MESSDERSTAHIIAERTLAVASDAPEPYAVPARLVAFVGVAVLVSGAAIAVWLFAGPPARGESSAGTAASRPGEKGALDGEARAGGVGWLSCNSWPSAHVYVDGKRLPGVTPMSAIELPAGIHTVALVSRDGASRKEVQVEITASQTRTIWVSLER